MVHGGHKLRDLMGNVVDEVVHGSKHCMIKARLPISSTLLTVIVIRLLTLH